MPVADLALGWLRLENAEAAETGDIGDHPVPAGPRSKRWSAAGSGGPESRTDPGDQGVEMRPAFPTDELTRIPLPSGGSLADNQTGSSHLHFSGNLR